MLLLPAVALLSTSVSVMDLVLRLFMPPNCCLEMSVQVKFMIMILMRPCLVDIYSPKIFQVSLVDFNLFVLINSVVVLFALLLFHSSFDSDPDILIRTSGEFRISNFLLWQVRLTHSLRYLCLSGFIGVYLCVDW